MRDLLDGALQALRLLLGGDAETWRIIGLSLCVSGLALLYSALLGIPLGVLLGLRAFRGRQLAIALVYTGMGFPPVVIGLFVYLLLSRAGLLLAGRIVEIADVAMFFEAPRDARTAAFVRGEMVY